MVRKYRASMFAILLAGAAFLSASARPAAQSSPNKTTNPTDQIATQVDHRLFALPFLSVFDNLKYEVKGTEVTLAGQTVLDTVKHDAESVVKGIPGVTRVTNEIEVLPAAPFDDQIRRAEFRAIYGDPALERYRVGIVPRIHIIVNGGHVTLEGMVDNATDKNIAAIRAGSVRYVFSVTNNLETKS